MPLIIVLTSLAEVRAMSKLRSHDPKLRSLARDGLLNPHSEAVKDSLFTQHPFFDPRDLLQTRYEMLRRHLKEGVPVASAAAAFGVSRQTFYQALAAFNSASLNGLLPKRRGPQHAHKLTPEVIDAIRQLKAAQPTLTTSTCLQFIKDHYGLTVHRRSLERALCYQKKASGQLQLALFRMALSPLTKLYEQRSSATTIISMSQ